MLRDGTKLSINRIVKTYVETLRSRIESNFIRKFIRLKYFNDTYNIRSCEIFITLVCMYSSIKLIIVNINRGYSGTRGFENGSKMLYSAIKHLERCGIGLASLLEIGGQ